MRNFAVFLSIVTVCGMGSCRDKDPEITQTYELSAEMMAYFVDYEVGTKWIYQDINDTNNYDTIELITKKPYDVTDGRTLNKGYELYYKPHKSKDFRVITTAGKNNRYYVKVDPMVTAAGAVIFENTNGIWDTGVIYHDSIDIKGTQFYKVVESQSHSSLYHAFVHIGKQQGIIFFSNISNKGNYKLINTIKP